MSSEQRLPSDEEPGALDDPSPDPTPKQHSGEPGDEADGVDSSDDTQAQLEGSDEPASTDDAAITELQDDAKAPTDDDPEPAAPAVVDDSSEDDDTLHTFDHDPTVVLTSAAEDGDVETEVDPTAEEYQPIRVERGGLRSWVRGLFRRSAAEDDVDRLDRPVAVDGFSDDQPSADAATVLGVPTAGAEEAPAQAARRLMAERLTLEAELAKGIPRVETLASAKPAFGRRASTTTPPEEIPSAVGDAVAAAAVESASAAATSEVESPLQAEVEQLESLVQERHDQLVELHSVCERLLNERDQLVVERDRLAAERVDVVAERDQLLADQSSTRDERLTSLLAEVEDLRDAHATAELALRQTQAELDEAEERTGRRFEELLTAERATFVDECEALRERARSAERDSAAARTTSAELQERANDEATKTLARLEELQRDLDAAGVQIERAAANESELRAQHESLSDELSRERAQAQKAVGELTNRLDTSTREMESLSAALSRRTAHSAELEALVAEREKQIQTASEQTARLRQLVADNQIELKKEKEKLVVAEAGVTDITAVARRFQQDARGLQEKLRLLLVDKDEREKEYVGFRSKLETALADARTSLEDRERRLVFLQESVEKAEMRGLELEDRLGATSQRLESLRQQAGQQLAKKDETHGAAVASLEAQMAELRRTTAGVEERDASRAAENDRLEARIREKDAQVNELLQLMDSRSVALKKAESALNQANDRHEQLLKKHNALNQRALQLNDALDERGGQIRDLEERLKKAEQTRLQAESRQALLSRELDSRTARVGVLEASMKDSEATRIGLEQRARSLTETLSERLDPMTRGLQEQTQRVAELESALEDEGTNRAGLEQRIRALSNELEQRSDRMAELEMIVLDAQGQREALHRFVLERGDPDDAQAFEAMLRGEDDRYAELIESGHARRAADLKAARSAIEDRDQEIRALRAQLSESSHQPQMLVSTAIDAHLADDQRPAPIDIAIDTPIDRRELSSPSFLPLDHEMASLHDEPSREKPYEKPARRGFGSVLFALVLAVLGVSAFTAFKGWNEGDLLPMRAPRHLPSSDDLLAASASDVEDVRGFVKQWAGAIERRQTDVAIALYRPEFVPVEFEDRDAFERDLDQLLLTADYMDVGHDQLDVRRATDGRLVATFPMKLRARGHIDVGNRQLWLARFDDGKLRIEAQAWVP